MLFALLPAAAPALVGLLEGGWDAEASGGYDGSGGEGATVDADTAAMLLGDICECLQKEFGGEDEAGLLLSAAPVGPG